MNLNYDKSETLLGTSHYITSLFRNISTKLGTLIDTSELEGLMDVESYKALTGN